MPRSEKEPFPKQNDDLGKVVDILLNNEPVKAKIVRSDANIRKGRIYYIEADHLYVFEYELPGFTIGEHGPDLGKRVCALLSEGPRINGSIVRDDNDFPYETLIKLDDGRYVLSGECQLVPIDR